jgi:hypothetical protein
VSGGSQNGAHAALVAHMKIAMTPCAATLAPHVASVIATDSIYKRGDYGRAFVAACETV